MFYPDRWAWIVRCITLRIERSVSMATDHHYYSKSVAAAVAVAGNQVLYGKWMNLGSTSGNYLPVYTTRRDKLVRAP